MTRNIQQHPSSVDTYIRHGWKLIPIPPNSKGPKHKGWNQPEASLRNHVDLLPGWGIGLAHAYSGTMALDIDDWDKATEELMKRGIILDQLYNAPDAVTIESGVDGHGKLIYMMPGGIPLPSKKLIYEKATGEKVNYLDFRCATQNSLTSQDILPPSIHPDTGQPYRWSGNGHWSKLPTIPDALLKFWNNLINDHDTPTIPTSTSDVSWVDIETALGHISPDIDRDEWIHIGMALHQVGKETDTEEFAFSLWDKWSSRSEKKYKGTKDLISPWRSFTSSNGITLGTLFHKATDGGWVRPEPQVEHLFHAIKDPQDPEELQSILRPPPPDPCLELWPETLATRAREVSEQVGCDPLVPLFAGLATVSGAVDARIRLELVNGFNVPPVAWLMTIGAPADKKTPGSRPMFKILEQIEREDRERYATELLMWEGKQAAFLASKKAFLEWAASPEAMLGSEPPPVVELPPQPVPLRFTVSDVTSQRLVRIAEQRPEGVLCYLDEMNAWIQKITDKRSGDDRSCWTVAYESNPYMMDRQTTADVYCENFAISVYGNVQPQVFREAVSSLAADGMLQRFIPGALRQEFTKRGNPVPDFMTNIESYNTMVRLCHALPDQTYTLTPEAHNVFRSFQMWYEDMKRYERDIVTGNAGDVYMSAFGKMEGVVGRIALLFHLMTSPFDQQVSEQTMNNAIELTKKFIVPAIRFSFGDMAGLTKDSIEIKCFDLVIERSAGEPIISMTEIKRQLKTVLVRAGKKSVWEQNNCIVDAMEMLELARWVIRTHNNPSSSRVEWAINPKIKDLYHDYRQRIKDARKRLREML